MNTSNRHAPRPTTYADAQALLDSRDTLKIGHNTFLERLWNGKLGVRLHNTYIVKFNESGSIELFTGGYRTVTTKERINRYLPPGLSLYQEKHVWYVLDQRRKFAPEGMVQWDKRLRVEFSDGMTIKPGESLHGLDRAED